MDKIKDEFVFPFERLEVWQLAVDLSTEFLKIVNVTVRGKEPLIFNDAYDGIS